MESPESDEPDSTRLRPALRVARWIGLVAFVGVSFLYLVAGLVAPIWAVGVLWVLWLVLLVTLLKVWRSHPLLVLAAPVLAYLIWAGALLAGEFFLGWSA